MFLVLQSPGGGPRPAAAFDGAEDRAAEGGDGAAGPDAARVRGGWVDVDVADREWSGCKQSTVQLAQLDPGGQC